MGAGGVDGDARGALRAALGETEVAAGRVRQELVALTALANEPGGPARDASAARGVSKVQGVNGNLSNSLRDLAQKVVAAAAAPSLGGHHSADAEAIAEALRNAADALPSTGDDTVTVITKAQTAADELRSVVTTTIGTTAPPEIRAHLQQMTVGDSLNFDQYFPEAAALETKDRAAVLKLIADHERSMTDGWVDINAGVIWKVPSPGLPRAKRYALLLVWPALVIAGALLAGDWISNNKPLGTPLHMLTALALVLAGALLHLVANAYKNKPWADAVFTSDLSNSWLLRPLRPAWLLVPPVTTLVILALSGVDLKHEGIPTFVLAGYSSDSIARLAFSKLDDLANTAAKSVVLKV